MHEVTLLHVFVHAPGGGNPVPLVDDASGMTAADMQGVAALHGHESSFVLPAEDPKADWRLRFFVPAHEMEMCGHATVGTMWALREWGRWTKPTARIETLSGLVDVRWDAVRGRAWISQPPVRRQPLDDVARHQVAAVLGIDAERPMVNAATSRIKTLVRLDDVASLQRLAPHFDGMAACCAAIDSTGLYPYALDDDGTVFARQFPRASGYPEDAATGIAAAALWGHLAAEDVIEVGTPDDPVLRVVRQGDAMGRPSAIELCARFDASGARAGCWLTGQVAWA